jgi:hypothetical protein
MKRRKLVSLAVIASVFVAITAYIAAQNLGLAEEDRWYATLCDDKAGAKAWVDAAYRITLPADVTVLGEGHTTWPPRKPGFIPPMRGEKLRAKANPSVLELIAKRAAQISQAGEVGLETFAMNDGCRVALFGAQWDAKAAGPLLAAQMRRCVAYIPTGLGNVFPSPQNQLSQRIAKITTARVQAGDRSALDEYAVYMRQFDVEHFEGFSAVDCLEPLWSFPDEAPNRSLAEALFLKPAAKWRYFLPKDIFATWSVDVLKSPMLGVAAFRQETLAELSNETLLMKIRLPTDKGNQFDVHNQWIQHFLWDYPTDVLAPKDGNYDLRICDVYASGLSRVRGLPWVAWYWPAEKRDAARALMIQRLKQYGPRFAYSTLEIPGDPESSMPAELHVFAAEARMTFKKFDHPATKAEVESGDAIFSLEGPAECRVVPLASFPTRAKWATLTDHPGLMQTYDPKTKVSTEVPVVDQSGLIWQAEEILQNGKWIRYYGFVGRHVIEKVPATEIEFLKEGERYFAQRL